ncbi:MAG TPA: type II toxin-antitoxin system VapC family toxin [Acidimicrobiales bacterium]|nr:type II toxin-antitoxin system VapC family toxin [Acidimicrobiales bacterium]
MIVLDTNVTSELMRASPSRAVVAWLRSQDPNELYSTAATVAEVRYGIARLPSSANRRRLSEAAVEVFSAFPDRVLAFDLSAAGEYGDLVAARERAGTPINGFDAQVAAICRSHRAALATRNVKDFENTGIRVANPWAET